MTKVFIDGSAGTTGLRIFDRLSTRKDIELITLSDDVRKDPQARKNAINSADIAFLCLPDAAAKESVSLVENNNTVIIDTSTAHRTNEEFAYGFAELSEEFFEKLRTSKRIAVPGCHASGFIALVYPLVKSGVLSADAFLSAFSVTGFSGGGKQMIADYESEDRAEALSSPRQYGIAQGHKHLPEMVKYTGINNAPVFSPVVADFYSGMQVTVPLNIKEFKEGTTVEDIKNIYKNLYNTSMVKFVDSLDNGGFIASNMLSGYDNMAVTVCGNDDRVILVALYDNLGKGASGAAIECMNISLGLDPTTGLDIKEV
ncbi:MAG: N-acetyl-gamma-glutamyl-phosphate reductase [Clostridia bacterium]|nr:N-acetyl-gamma-glutamyl-phosphate reductase [Clostridia bacterium]